ncbi:D-alanyl-D-alanine endopeptidase [Limnobacter sp. 130]|jgi:serine-type D-Ala-D-Ala endopeptidase (penicillin-binding protein 7)|uniref:serine hydrolase n=1 Tax=Limnobacter sp. 130 TaxID=2653147 RepID=UPI0012EF828A|nr:serine hydrolase [Limnobacter sp. 130]VWX35749.1 D-alanyl-D-alanine endopeptidase [Limnobacter sp. 130]
MIYQALLGSTLLAFSMVFSHSVQAAPGQAERVNLKEAHDPLSLNSSVALVADADSLEVLYAKNPSAVVPIASITKIMTVVVTLEAGLDLDDVITITTDDIDYYKNTRSRLKPGSEFTRRELIHLALMASENRAASALGRSYPGGLAACVAQMNRRAASLQMLNTNFAETTGLSVENKSSANDLARMVLHAQRFPLIRQFSTDPQFSVQSGKGQLNFRNTNRLIKNKEWDIQVQKTGFINEAGRCLVMKARVGDRNLVIVLLDALGSQARFADAERIREYVMAVAPSAATYVTK